jgi:hypothetical protein
MSEYVRRLREKIGNDFMFMPSVAALIRDEDGRILLVQHVEGRWQLPGGAVDPGERPAAAMQRECAEEAGIAVDPIGVAGVYGGLSTPSPMRTATRPAGSSPCSRRLVAGDLRRAMTRRRPSAGFGRRRSGARARAVDARRSMHYSRSLSVNAVGVDRLVVRGGKLVLHELSCNVVRGSVTGLLGQGGSRKSTLIRASSACRSSAAASCESSDRPPAQDIRPRVGYDPGAVCLRRLTVRETCGSSRRCSA